MRSLCLAVIAILALASFLHAQEAPSPGGPPPASKAEAQPVDIGDVQTLKVNVNLVNVYFSVRDKSGFITNLHKDDCSIFENKELQKTKNFTQEKNLPLTIGILLDTSGSQQNVLPLDINVNLLADYTNSPREIKRSIDSAQINTGAGTGSVTGNGTARGTLLYDAVYLAAHDKLRQEAGRKILVLLTDGGDQGSQETLKSATEAAQKANAIVYVILLSDRGFYGGGFGINLADTGERDMQKLATDTRGRGLHVGNNGKKLQEAFDQIQDELRTQYLASFTPTNSKIDGTFRTLNITCQPGQKIQARKGYYAIADALDPDQ